MVDLSFEIIVFEILTRVPAKVVGRSRSVCKEWYRLLSTQDFAKRHCSRSYNSSNQKTLLVGNLTCTIHRINFQSMDYGPGTTVDFPFNDFSIHSHLDGLLCITLHHTQGSVLLLWNPVTGKYNHLSTDDGHGFFENMDDAIGLYIDADDDYKVLHIQRRCGVYGVFVYSRRLHSWRKIPFVTRPEYIRRRFHWSDGTLCGDTLYFLPC
jgi:hypothetical protein